MAKSMPKKSMSTKKAGTKMVPPTSMPNDNDADDAPMGYKKGGMVKGKKK